jgi:tRNA pseudouridine38-40 synthase
MDDLTPTHRWVAAVEYDGTPFFGWQRQAQTPTVQACLEMALSSVANQTIEVHASGRTDTGVHAKRQVVHFDTSAQRSARSWLLGTQTGLHEGISVAWIQAVDGEFHARYSAVGRHYRYRIINRINRPALDRFRAAWVHRPLDADAMHQSAQALVGEHDFSSFRAAGCQAKHARREIHEIRVTRQGDDVFIDVYANAFLYHMVRNIAGSLMMVGRGERSISWIDEVLALQDRSQSGVTAPPHGLYFMAAFYEAHWGLPDEVTQ